MAPGEPATTTVSAETLHIPAEVVDQMVAHAATADPLEACGLLIGRPGRPGPGDSGDSVTGFVPCTNAAASARVYRIPPVELLRAERAAESAGQAVIGVMHSHTHTEPFPSPTDVAEAPDPSWHYVIVGLRRTVAEVRSYRIVATDAAAPVRESSIVVTPLR